MSDKNFIDLGYEGDYIYESTRDQIKYKLTDLLHHYEGVEPTLRVMEFEERVGPNNRSGFHISSTPVITDDDPETVIQFLNENGFEAILDGVILIVVGVSESKLNKMEIETE